MKKWILSLLWHVYWVVYHKFWLWFDESMSRSENFLNFWASEKKLKKKIEKVLENVEILLKIAKFFGEDHTKLGNTTI